LRASSCWQSKRKPRSFTRLFVSGDCETLLIDTYLTNEPAASSRVWRVYRQLPAHYHSRRDEYRYVLSGRGIFWMGDASDAAEFAPGDLLFFKCKTAHALPKIVDGPVVFLSFDTPRRDPKDIIFVNPNDGTPETFVQKSCEIDQADCFAGQRA